ncbi:MAG: beta-lactamase family protein [bacterium]|nr:beta-lactamase family protein [bacterium]
MNFRLPLVVALAIPSLARAQDLPITAPARSVEQRITDLLEEWHAAGRFPGASVGLVVDGKRIACCVGAAPDDAEKPIEVDDLFLSGSIGKTYLAAAALRSEGFDLDARLSESLGDRDWFERLPNANAITLRHLLRHETGVPRHVFSPDFQAALIADRDRVWKPDELVAYVLDAKPMFAAGKGWAYADTNYVLLGMAFEEFTGKKWYDYAREELIAPLGLERTVPSDQRRIPGLVQASVVMGRAFGFGEFALEDGAYAVNPQFEWCGGGWASSAGDLAVWAHALYAGDVLTAEQRALMLDTVPARGLGPKREYGLGVMVTETELGPMHGHDGFMPGYLATMGFFPESGVAGALMLNGDDARGVGRPLYLLLVEIVRVATGG